MIVDEDNDDCRWWSLMVRLVVYDDNNQWYGQ